MLQELIDFIRPGGQETELKPIKFAPCLNSLAHDVSSELARRGVKLVVATPPPSVPVRIDPNRLSRLVYNLLSNAADEIKAGGEIVIQEVRS
jgi:signal transduction histidine kinase